MGDKDQTKDKDYTLFAHEEEVMAQVGEMLAKLDQVAEGVNHLAKAYGRQFNEQQKLVRFSDRMQLELHEANQRMTEQADELTDLNLALTAEIEQRKKLEEELRHLASTDSLTGLLTRRRFFELGAAELARMNRRKKPISIIIMDLDYFKRINDQYGHAVGDQVLASVGRLYRTKLREFDIIGRLGGEEFGLVLPETDLEAARLIAERFRRELRTLQWNQQDQTLTVTASMGLAQLQSAEQTLEEAFSRADSALYQAKALGRDRIVSTTDQRSPNQD